MFKEAKTRSVDMASEMMRAIHTEMGQVFSDFKDKYPEADFIGFISLRGHAVEPTGDRTDELMLVATIEKERREALLRAAGEVCTYYANEARAQQNRLVTAITDLIDHLPPGTVDDDPELKEMLKSIRSRTQKPE
jgi:hypothetical protein